MYLSRLVPSCFSNREQHKLSRAGQTPKTLTNAPSSMIRIKRDAASRRIRGRKQTQSLLPGRRAPPFCCRCRVSRQPHAEFRLRQVAETETARSLSESICSCARASFLSDLLRSDRRAIRANQYKLGQPITTRTLAAGICCRGGQFHCQNGLRIKSASNCR